MTRLEARDYAKILLNQVNSDTQWTDIEINNYLREANRDVWYEVSDADDSHFTASASISYPAGVISVDLAAVGFIAAPFDSVIKVLRMQNLLDGFGEVLDPVPGGISNLEVYGSVNVYSYGNSKTYCTIFGTSLFLIPRPGNVTYLLVQYVPVAQNLDTIVAPATSADVNNLLDNKLHRLHEYVCAKAVIRALAARQLPSVKTLDMILSQGAERLSALKRGRLKHRSNTVRRVYSG